MEYKRYKISKGRVLMIPESVQKIMNWPVLKSGKEVATFLRFSGYYRTFIPQYSKLTNRLNGIKKAEKFLWNEEIGRDFVELKREGYRLFPFWSRRSVHFNP